MKNLHILFLAASIAFGMTSCKGDKTEVPDMPEENAEVVDLSTEQKSMLVQPEKTTVYWACSKPGTTHEGTVGVQKGSVQYAGNTLIGADIVMDMSTINVTDLTGDSKKTLEAHLKGTASGKEDDFFNVAKYPHAAFKTTKVVKLSNDPAFNYLVYGNLTMKGITQEIGFKANVDFEGNTVDIRSEKFSINRTEWGIHFRSPSVFSGLQDKFIDDEIQLEIHAVATANQ